ncbi:hypothetical protein BASA81_003455 [Batrachochytrium salamandrivorans]|nr:hypothetical protein BASA81_003455 [Batrachochytrium salamandrivorans]
MVEMLGLGASLVDADLSRKTRVDELLWREEDLRFMDMQRQWNEEFLRQRKQDLGWRREERFQRDLSMRMREIDEKNETLKNTGNVAALLAGFSMSALVQISPDTDTPIWLITMYTTVSATVICLMSFCFITCALILVGTLKKFEISHEETGEENFATRYGPPPLQDGSEDQVAYNEHTRRRLRKQRFTTFWETTCQQDFHRAYLAFSAGVPLFLVNTLLATWVKFNYGVIWPGILVSLTCGLTILIMFATLQLKWGVYLSTPNTTTPTPSSVVEEDVTSS